MKKPSDHSEGSSSLVQGLVHMKVAPFKNPGFQVHPTGVEPVTFGFVDSRTISVIPLSGVTCEDPIANLPPNLPPELEKIVTAWPTLPEPIRRAMLAILEAAT